MPSIIAASAAIPRITLMIIILRRFFLSCSSFLARARVLVPAAAPEALSAAAGPYVAGRDPVERVLVCSTEA